MTSPPTQPTARPFDHFLHRATAIEVADEHRQLDLIFAEACDRARSGDWRECDAFWEEFTSSPALIGDIITAATDALAAAKSALAARMSVDTILNEGLPYAQIVDTARNGNYDLIVMGTHGRTGLRHALLGSVAERVVRLASCPVLTVREPAGVATPVARFVTDVSSDRTKVLS